MRARAKIRMPHAACVVHCALYIVRCALCVVHCALRIVHCALCIERCAPHAACPMPHASSLTLISSLTLTLSLTLSLTSALFSSLTSITVSSTAGTAPQSNAFPSSATKLYIDCVRQNQKFPCAHLYPDLFQFPRYCFLFR